MQQTFFEESPIFCTEKEKNVFEAPFGGLGATYAVHLRLIGKRIVDFLLVIIELFLLAVTLLELRANIDWNAPF